MSQERIRDNRLRVELDAWNFSSPQFDVAYWSLKWQRRKTEGRLLKMNQINR